MTRRSFFAGLIGAAVATVAGSRPRPRWEWKRPAIERGHYTKRQESFPLEAVGVDWGGRIKPIRDLSVDGPVTRVVLAAPRSRGRT